MTRDCQEVSVWRIKPLEREKNENKLKAEERENERNVEKGCNEKKECEEGNGVKLSIETRGRWMTFKNRKACVKKLTEDEIKLKIKRKRKETRAFCKRKSECQWDESKVSSRGRTVKRNRLQTKLHKNDNRVDLAGEDQG